MIAGEFCKNFDEETISVLSNDEEFY